MGDSPMSAFAAYNCSGGKCTRAKKPATKKPAVKTLTGVKAKKKPSSKAVGGSKGKTLAKRKPATTKSKPSGRDVKPQAKAKSSAASKPKASSKSKATTTKPKAKSNGQKKLKTLVGKCGPQMASDLGFNPNDIDKLVERYFGGDMGQKLSAAEQKIKEKLETYLMAQLNDGEDDFGSEEDDSYSDEYSGESGSESYSDEYSSGESFSDESGDEDTDYSGSETGSYTETHTETDFTSESGTEKVKTLVGEILSRGSQSLKNPPAQKRKINESQNAKKKVKNEKTSKATATATTVADGGLTNGTSEVKKVKPTDGDREKKSNERKSLPVTTAVPKIEKGAVCYRRSMGGANDTAVNSTQSIKKAPKVEKPSALSSANVVRMDSVKEGANMFQWLLSPIAVNDFFANYWERNACLVKRNSANYFSNLISFQAIGQMLLKNHVEFTKNIDITSYKNGVRETHNPEGRAMPPDVWNFYEQGCSIRLLNPQTFIPAVFKLNTTLQEYFHCFVGANVYLTPPNSQGFAPHYDDIEAFVLQIEGRKRWKLYKPHEILPRYSSPNFSQKEIGKPIFDEVLQPGDMLYFPRGTIHQASTEPGFHSLHITLSVYQRQSYGDVIELMMPLLAKQLIASSAEIRKGLPLHTWRNAGLAFSGVDSPERTNLQQTVAQILTAGIRKLDVDRLLDEAVDQMAKKYQHEALPPEIHPSEATRTIFGLQSRTNDRGEYVCDYKLDLRTNVRLLRANILRLVREDSKINIYYYLDNSKEYCEYEPNFFEVEAEAAGSVEVLIKSYPQYVSVSQLPMPDDDAKIDIALSLWERGLLMTEKPFK